MDRRGLLQVMRRAGVASEHRLERKEMQKGGLGYGEAWGKAWVLVRDRHGLSGELDEVVKDEDEKEERPKRGKGNAKYILRGRTCAEWQTIAWVADNVGFEDPDPRDCPSARAWGMWKWASESSGNTSKFWERIYPLITPTKEMMDSEARKTDDGTADMQRLDEIARAMEHARIDAEDFRRAAGAVVSAPGDGSSGAASLHHVASEDAGEMQGRRGFSGAG